MENILINQIYSLIHSMMIKNFSTNTAYNTTTVQWNGYRLPCTKCNEAQITAVFSQKYQAFIICCHKLPGFLEKVIFSFYLSLVEDTTERCPGEIVTEMRSIEQAGWKARTLCRRNNFQLSSCLLDKMSWTPLVNEPHDLASA